MKLIVSVFAFLLVFAFFLSPLLLFDFSVCDDPHAPFLSFSAGKESRPFSVSVSTASLGNSTFVQGLTRACSFLPFYLRDGAKAAFQGIGALFTSLLTLL